MTEGLAQAQLSFRHAAQSPKLLASAYRHMRLRWAGENDMVNRHEEWGTSADTAAGEPTRASFSLPMFEQFAATNQHEN